MTNIWNEFQDSRTSVLIRTTAVDELSKYGRSGYWTGKIFSGTNFDFKLWLFWSLPPDLIHMEMPIFWWQDALQTQVLIPVRNALVELFVSKPVRLVLILFKVFLALISDLKANSKVFIPIRNGLLFETCKARIDII